MIVPLYNHQYETVPKIRNGCVVEGGTGAGKSRTALAYFFYRYGAKLVDGGLEISSVLNLPKIYIITIAKKRDSFDWDEECSHFALTDNFIVDSWNNIKKYQDIKNSIFIFDEQKLVSYGIWSKVFIKIAKNNKWILLSATPGDKWIDYLSVFIANGFYKNKTEFIREHVIYSRFTKFPKIDRYIGVSKLHRNRKQILIKMKYHKHTITHRKYLFVDYDKEKYKRVEKDRWDVFHDEPLKNSGALCYAARRVVNENKQRTDIVKELITKHFKIILFYNYNYELYLLTEMLEEENITYSQYNGWKHEPIPDDDMWVYLVNYMAGAEAWNCIDTDTVVFFSLNYSYRITKQSEGRIDRANTPFIDLYDYYILTNSNIDKTIMSALKNKKKFNESSYFDQL